MVNDKRLIIIVVSVVVHGRLAEMNKDQQLRAEEIIMDLCFRIECMCRYSPLDNQEVTDQAIMDRRIIEGLYVFYRNKGDEQNIAAKKARANAIRLILNEVFS